METVETTKRIQTTVMLDPDVRRELRRMSANNDERVSDIINRSVRIALNMDRKPAA